MRPRPMSGVTAMLRPKERAIRSMTSSDFFSGNKAAMREYPGKKRMNGRPMTILSGLSGVRYIVGMRIRERATIATRSQNFPHSYFIHLETLNGIFRTCYVVSKPEMENTDA